jgi:hypothetical protein
MVPRYAESGGPNPTGLLLTTPDRVAAELVPAL